MTGHVTRIEITINGGYGNQDVERIEIDSDAAAVIVTITGQLYSYVLSGSPSSSNYSCLLSSLEYVSSLPLEALSEPARNITITAFGGNNHSVTAVANIMLTAANIGDPVFDSEPVEIFLEENTVIGGLIATIEATDPEGRQVSYSFKDQSPYFSISISGEVRVLDSAALDYENETNRVFLLTVVASDDDPVSPRSSETPLRVSLTNTNDNPPLFTTPLYTFYVLEEATGAIVGSVKATDADSTDLIYNFQSAVTRIMFTLNGTTGEISVRSQLDYELTNSHSFHVQATDGLFVSFAQVIVNVIDVADNRPVAAPTEKSITVNLDSGGREIPLNEGTGGPLVVSDNSTALVSGYADINVVRSGTVETFPNQYGACECTDPACLDVFTLCGTSFSLQQDLFSGVTTASSGGPSLVPSLNFTVYSFNGRNDHSNNWLEIPSTVKTQFLQRTDDFTISFWIRVLNDSSSSYILSFELDTNRYFSLFEASAQTLVFYYFRDNIPGITTDDGRTTLVALTFFYNASLFPSGLRENQWHFISFSVDFPSVILNVDGYKHRPTRGNYRNQFDSRVDLVQLTDGTFYNMPAPILTKTQAQIDGISGKIGGTARGDRFSLSGEMRQLTQTDLFDTNTLNCIASCNTRIGIASEATISSSISTIYNPTTRRFVFSGAATPSQYTTLLQSLVYFSNGFLLPEEEGEIRVISISIQDEVDFGNVAQISVIGRSNQRDPVLDTNGDTVDGVDLEVDFREDDVRQVSIISPHAFISDDDIDAQVVWVSAMIVNPQLPVSQEHLNIIDSYPSVLNVSGANSVCINFTVPDPSLAKAYNFITALLNVRYINTADEPVAVDRVILLNVSDGLHTGSAITTVRVLTVNDPPLLDLNRFSSGFGTSARYTESRPPLSLAPNLVLSDPDSLNMVEAHARIADVFDEGNESIALDMSLLPPGVSCTPDSCNGTDIVINGAGLQPHYEALLRTLRYINLQLPADLPNLRDRVVYVSISDGVSSSDPTARVLIDFFPLNPRVILELAAPRQNFTTTFIEDESGPIKCYSQVRIADSSVNTLQSIVVSIRDNLPEGVTEEDELTLTSPAIEGISIEINAPLKKITFSRVASIDQYAAAIELVRYFNRDDDPYPINRFVDFLIVPEGGAPNDHAHCNITIVKNVLICGLSGVQSAVAENSPVNTLVTRLMLATDEYGLINRNISYSLASGNSTLFSVAPNGEVFLLSTLDREVVDEYRLQADACDSGNPEECCQLNVTISVTDVNDNPPSFEQPLYEFSVEENLVVNLTVFTILDNDVGMNAAVASLEITNSSFSPPAACIAHFVIELSPIPTLTIASPNGIDFEQTHMCNFSIEVTDAGAPPLTGTTTVQVIVLDVDDTPPVFSFNSYIFSVEEDNNVSLVIGRVSANDVESQSTFFSLTGTTMFEIDQESGNVFILFSSNHDIATEYHFTVEAQDPIGNSATAAVTVNIVAINNDPPVLDLNATAFGSNNAERPVVFVEEGGAVVIATDSLIRDHDEVPLTITRLHIEVANSGRLEHEVISLVDRPSLSNAYSILSSTPGVLTIAPTDAADISTVYSILQSIQYRNTEDEISACRDDLYPCRFGPLSRTLLFSVFDGIFYSNQSEAYVMFEEVNDPPFVDLDNTLAGVGFLARLTEGGGPVRIVNDDGFTVFDVDDEHLESLTCTLTNPLDGDGEFIFFLNDTSLPPELTLLTDGHTLQITGSSSVSNYKSALSLVHYNHISASPDTAAARLIAVSLFDGEAISNLAIATILFLTKGEETNEIPDQSTSAIFTGRAIYIVILYTSLMPFSLHAVV